MCLDQCCFKLYFCLGKKAVVSGMTPSHGLDLETENQGALAKAHCLLWQMEMGSELKESPKILWAKNNWSLYKA